MRAGHGKITGVMSKSVGTLLTTLEALSVLKNIQT